jgi:predicted lactoylglutathione lyase
MRPKIFINLPVSDLKRSMEFYSNIGFRNEPMFTDETAAAMQFSDEIFVMLLTHEKYSTFTKKPIVDTSTNSAALYALQLESLGAMNRLFEDAIAAGGREASDAKDYGFMQQRSFEDLDGHTWEVFYMDIEKFSNLQTATHA